jgi:hypothetical protein
LLHEPIVDNFTESGNGLANPAAQTIYLGFHSSTADVTGFTVSVPPGAGGDFLIGKLNEGTPAATETETGLAQGKMIYLLDTVPAGILRQAHRFTGHTDRRARAGLGSHPGHE